MPCPFETSQQQIVADSVPNRCHNCAYIPDPIENSREKPIKSRLSESCTSKSFDCGDNEHKIPHYTEIDRTKLTWLHHACANWGHWPWKLDLLLRVDVRHGSRVQHYADHSEFRHVSTVQCFPAGDDSTERSNSKPHGVELDQAGGWLLLLLWAADVRPYTAEGKGWESLHQSHRSPASTISDNTNEIKFMVCYSANSTALRLIFFAIFTIFYQKCKNENKIHAY